MVKIRLTRMGRKNIPHYRIVVTDSQNPRDGKYIECVGYYNPKQNLLEINKERISYWLSCGAQPTEIVKRLLSKVEKNLNQPLKGGNHDVA
jgi:small subunit ribosomal protein S16|uniref:Small ribosomal subunit protein bS16 n=1 Tax=candidate division WOR-3 bacterium TaxID=2052148 RepID=A0A7V5Y0J3_UNCW3